MLFDMLSHHDLISLGGVCTKLREEVGNYLKRKNLWAYSLDMRQRTLLGVENNDLPHVLTAFMWNARRKLITYIRVVRFTKCIDVLQTDGQQDYNPRFRVFLLTSPQTCFLIHELRKEFFDPTVWIENMPLNWLVRNLKPVDSAHFTHLDLFLVNKCKSIVNLIDEIEFRWPLFTNSFPHLKRIYIAASVLEPGRQPGMMKPHPSVLEHLTCLVSGIIKSAPQIELFEVIMRDMCAADVKDVGDFVKQIGENLNLRTKFSFRSEIEVNGPNRYNTTVHVIANVAMNQLDDIHAAGPSSRPD